MKEKVTIEWHSNLPMPLIYLASAEDLARWHTGQLEWAYDQGHRNLSLSFFDTAAMGIETNLAARAVLDAVMDFLHTRPDVVNVTILCGNTDPQPLMDMLAQYGEEISAVTSDSIHLL